MHDGSIPRDITKWYLSRCFSFIYTRQKLFLWNNIKKWVNDYFNTLCIHYHNYKLSPFSKSSSFDFISFNSDAEDNEDRDEWKKLSFFVTVCVKSKKKIIYFWTFTYASLLQSNQKQDSWVGGWFGDGELVLLL